MTKNDPMLEAFADFGGYKVDVLFHGFPGKSTHHGGLGWSTVVLLRGHGHVALVDTGPFGYRGSLLHALSKLNLKPDDITDLVLTHAHHDHIVNYVLFKNANIVIGKKEMDWALTVPWGESPVPELYVRELMQSPKLRLLEEGDEALPGIVAYLAPGHTPGHLIFVLSGKDRDLILLQDAVKTKAELVSRETDMTYDAAVSAQTVERVWELWRRRPGTILIPGHDMPLMLDGDKIVTLGHRQAGIRAVFRDSLDDPTMFNVTET